MAVLTNVQLAKARQEYQSRLRPNAINVDKPTLNATIQEVVNKATAGVQVLFDEIEVQHPGAFTQAEKVVLVKVIFGFKSRE